LVDISRNNCIYKIIMVHACSLADIVLLSQLIQMVMLLTCIFEVIGLNLAWDTNYYVLHSFLQFCRQIQGEYTKLSRSHFHML